MTRGRSNGKFWLGYFALSVIVIWLLFGCADFGAVKPAKNGTAIVTWKILQHGESVDCGVKAVACTKLVSFETVNGKLLPHYQLIIPPFEHIAQSRDPWGHEILHVIYGRWHGSKQGIQ